MLFVIKIKFVILCFKNKFLIVFVIRLMYNHNFYLFLLLFIQKFYVIFYTHLNFSILTFRVVIFNFCYLPFISFFVS
jgi:hypothetical protein